MKAIIDSLKAAGITEPVNLSWVRLKHFWYFLTHKQHRLMRMSMRDITNKINQQIKKAQNNCPHRMGCNPLGVSFIKETSIVWHYFNDDIWRGICTNCLRYFLPTDNDYEYWRKQSTYNIPSSSKPVLETENYPVIFYQHYHDPIDDLTDEQLVEAINFAKERYKLERSDTR